MISNISLLYLLTKLNSVGNFSKKLVKYKPLQSSNKLNSIGFMK